MPATSAFRKPASAQSLWECAEDLGIAPTDFFRYLEKVQEDHLLAHGLPTDRPVTAREAIGDLLDKDVRVECPDSPKFETSPYAEAEGPYALEAAGASPLATSRIRTDTRSTASGFWSFTRKAHETQPKGRLLKEFLLAMGTKKDKNGPHRPGRAGLHHHNPT